MRRQEGFSLGTFLLFAGIALIVPWLAGQRLGQEETHLTLYHPAHADLPIVSTLAAALAIGNEAAGTFYSLHPQSVARDDWLAPGEQHGIPQEDEAGDGGIRRRHLTLCAPPPGARLASLPSVTPRLCADIENIASAWNPDVSNPASVVASWGSGGDGPASVLFATFTERLDEAGGEGRVMRVIKDTAWGYLVAYVMAFCAYRWWGKRTAGASRFHDFRKARPISLQNRARRQRF